MLRSALTLGLVLGALTVSLLAQGPPGNGEVPGVGPYGLEYDERAGALVGVVPEEKFGFAAVVVSVDQKTGETIATLQLDLQVTLEPKPGVEEIRGPWDVGAAWVFDTQGVFEPAAITWLAVSVEFYKGEFVTALRADGVALSPTSPCSAGEKIVITGEDRRVVQFSYGHCQDGVWVYEGPFRARKVPRLPEELQPGQWVVLLEQGRGELTYRFYRAEHDGNTTTLVRTVPVGDTLPPGGCETCQYFLVEEGGTRLLYHCDPSGIWRLVREWKPPEARPSRGAPPEEQPPQEGPPDEEGPPPPS